MKESNESIHSKQEVPRRAKMRTEFGQFRNDWFEQKGIDIEGKTISELKGIIEDFYKENEDLIKEKLEEKGEMAEGELSVLAKSKLDLKDFKQIRQELELPKWVSLNEAVAFIKTIIDTDDRSAQEKYVEYAANGISLDDMRRILSFENDVKPARLDTDIYHQSPQRSRSAVEIVSNAVDAVNVNGTSIGRFGVGFYQILSHLNNTEDRVKVRTGNSKVGFFDVEFRNGNGNIEVHLEEADSKTKESKMSGTTVELLTENFPREEAENLVKKHLAYNSTAKIYLNGELVNDTSKFGINDKALPEVKITVTDKGYSVEDAGVGMAPQVILEKLLVPKFSGKKPVQEMLDMSKINPTFLIERKEKDSTAHGKAVINVGGVTVEEFELTGVNTLKTFVIDLPAFTVLGEERNKVAVDEITIAATKKLCDEIVSSQDYAVINSLAPVVAALQKRSLNHDQENNILAHLQEKAEGLPGDIAYLPNTDGFERLEIPNTVLLDSHVRQTNWGKVDGIDFIPRQMGEGLNLYKSKLKLDTGKPVVAHGRRLILDESVYKQYENDPTLPNLFLNYYGEGNAVKVKSIAVKEEKEDGDDERKNTSEQLEYLDFNDYVLNNWEALGYNARQDAEVDIEVKSLEQRETGKIVYEKIIRKFPPNLSLLFVDAMLRPHRYENYKTALDVDSLDELSSLLKNPELVGTLNTLGVPLLSESEQGLDSFPGMDKKWHRVEIDGVHGWGEVKYRDKWRLIDKTGKIYPGTVVREDERDRENAWYSKREFSLQTTDGKIPVIERSDKETIINFYDPTTDTFETKRIPHEGQFDSLYDIVSFGDRKIAAISTGGHILSGGRHLMGEGYLVDLNTGEVWNPKTEFDIPAGAKIRDINETAITYKTKNENLIEYHPDGTKREILRDWWKDQSVKLERDLERGFRVFYQDGSLKFFHGDRMVYEKEFSREDLEKTRGEDVSQLLRSGGWAHEPIKAKTFGGGEKNFILIDGFNNGEDKTAFLMDESGNKIYDLEKNQSLVFGGADGRGGAVFLILNYGVTMTLGGPIRSGISDYFYIDGTGKKIDSLDNTIFEVADHNPDPSQFPIMENTSWKTDPRKGEYGRYWIQLVNRADGKRLEGELSDTWNTVNFDTVQYIPERQLWRCVESDGYMLSNGMRDRKQRVFYLDNEGNVVDKKEYKKNYRGATSIDRWSSKKIELLQLDESFSHEKLAVMHRVIENSQIEDAERIDLFIKRCSRTNLGAAEFEIVAPVLMRVDYLDERLMNNETVNNFEGRLKQYDTETKAWFYKLLSHMLPEEIRTISDNSLSEKLVRVYQEKIAHLSEDEKQEIFNTLTQLREYHKGNDTYLITGINIIKNQSDVPSEQIPEKIRALVDYLRSDEKTALSVAQEEIKLEKLQEFTLSQLIQTKRLNESKVSNFNGTADELRKLVAEKTGGKRQDHIKREIIHPIYYQSIDSPYLFIRELVQNAHDAVKKDSTVRNRNIAIDVFSRNEGEVTLKIDDPVGMSTQEIINYFLIPGESTKIGDEETIGYFGQGLFTLFRGSKEVTLKTSKGDGRITKLRIVPARDEKGMTTDLQLQFEEEAGDFKGTTIERTVDTKYETVEAAYIKNATCTYTSLVDGNVVNIVLNGQSINRPQNVLSQTEIPNLGSLSIIDAPNSAVTQRGLYIKGLDEDFSTKMHDVEDLLRKRGIVVQIPDKVSLTRSRNDIARKEEVMGKIQEYMPLLKLQAYLELFREDIKRGNVIQLDNLPYDYFHSPYSRGGKVAKDAQNMKEGKPIEDVATYFERGSLIELLVLLPVVEIGERSYSLADLKEASLSDKPPLENYEKYRELPAILREKLQAGKSEYSRRSYDMQTSTERGEVVPDFPFEKWEEVASSARGIIFRNPESYSSMNEAIKELSNRIASSFKRAEIDIPSTTFYLEPGSKAHAASLWQMIGWNLNYWQGWKADVFKNWKDRKDASFKDFYDVFTHEWAHILEKTGAFTHNQSFYRKQAEVLSHLIYDKIGEELEL